MLICPTCMKQGLKSKVRVKPYEAPTCMTLEMRYPTPDKSFWDEHDNFHDHNHFVTKYICTNDHEFTNTHHCIFGDCCQSEEARKIEMEKIIDEDLVCTQCDLPPSKCKCDEDDF